MSLSITITELPPRARPLARQELAGVFGGCAPVNGPCAVDSDCCSRDCNPNKDGGAGVYERYYGCD